MNRYKIFKTINKIVRENIRPNAFLYLDKQGYFGKLLSYFGNKIIRKPMHKINRTLVSKYYNPKHDLPYKGSVLYTIFDFISYGLLFILISSFIILQAYSTPFVLL